MNKFIVIEGLDGAGKSTQINLLTKYFENKGIKYKYIHFPRLDNPIIGELISKFLRGELGSVDSVDPYLVALMYAVDRDNFADNIRAWLADDYLVLVDRYVYSNIAFQCAKLTDAEDKRNLKNWIKELEYNCNKLPVPDISLFLYVPFIHIEERLKSKRIGNDREYLSGQEDIHEKDLMLQKNVEAEYLSLAEEEKDFHTINCAKKENILLTAEEINNAIINVLNTEGIIK